MNIAETAAIVNALNNSGGGGGTTDPYAGWDIVIYSSGDFGAPASFLKGSFETIYNALANANPKPVTGCVVLLGHEGDGWDLATCAPFRTIALTEYGTQACAVFIDGNDGEQVYFVDENGITPGL